MSYSTETIIIANLFGYGAMALGILAIWFKTEKDQESYLLLKVLGYTFLAMFRFSLNQIHLPVGFVIAYILKQRTVRKEYDLQSSPEFQRLFANIMANVNSSNQN